MFFERDKIGFVVDHLMAYSMSIDVRINKKEDAEFNKALERMYSEKQYAQGEQISPEHLTQLKDMVKKAISSTTKYITENAQNKSKNLPNITDPADYLATIIDCYQARAMSYLGCPNMPIFIFDPDIKKAVTSSAIAIHKSYVKYGMTKEATHKQQRRKDAVEVKKDIEKNLVAIKKGHNKSRNMGELVAKYQALVQRQKDHTAFWRFFHGSENNARNELIAQMRDSIKNALPDGMKDLDIDNIKPAELARELANARIRGNVEIAGANRMSKQGMERIYGCQAATEAMSPEDELLNYMGKQPMNQSKMFMNDIIEKNDIISEPIKNNTTNEKSLSKEGNEFSLFNNG